MSLPWNAIDTALLDMDGTLLDLNFDNHFWNEFVPARWAQMHALDVEEAKCVLFPRFKAMEGRIEWYCLDYWSRELALDIAGLKAELSGLITVLPHVVDFLEALRQAGKRRVLVTNAHPDSLALKLEKTCLHEFLDAVISSHAFGRPKEDPAFWDRLHDVESFDPARAVLIDDSLPVLRAAHAHGVRHLCAVCRPDSRRPRRAVDEFFAVDDLSALLPIAPCAGSAA